MSYAGINTGIFGNGVVGGNRTRIADMASPHLEPLDDDHAWCAGQESNLLAPEGAGFTDRLPDHFGGRHVNGWRGRSRTHTDLVNSQMPLPIGLRAIYWRRAAELNRAAGGCSPVPDRSASPSITR